MKPEWDFTQDELMVVANCHLKEIHKNVDCEHCPSGFYCQDIGHAYQKKLLATFKARLLNGLGISLPLIESMLKQLSEGKDV